jgi:glycosyltransferase involved in cell wall biosynthesis
MKAGQDAAIIAVVIPAYKVSRHIMQVLAGIGPEVNTIYVVDDKCPEGSGNLVVSNCRDPRVRVLFHQENQGVGGATMSGYRQALLDGAEIMVKLDGDGQMDAALIPMLVKPLIEGLADYTKGNRFYFLEGVHEMPLVRLLGNAMLSFIAKFSTGYWDIFDPTNGFTAIHRSIAGRLPLEKIARRYFFESDLLFRLNTLKGVVMDIPMTARYGVEKSNLSVLLTIPEFSWKHLVNFCKRIFYNYYLRDFGVASLEILLGAMAMLFGVVFGGVMWFNSMQTGIPATSGTVMLAALPTLVGVQLLLAFLATDVRNIPRTPLQKRM